MRVAIGCLLGLSLLGSVLARESQAQPAAQRMERVEFATTVQVDVRMNYWLYLPLVVVAPQCEANVWWHGDAVAAFTKQVATTHKIDPQRIYLTGLSKGGFGTWDTAAKHPELYAAIAPICGGGNPEDVSRHKGIPAWVFHGARDRVVPLQRSEQMVKSLEAVGGDVKFTVYPEADHDSWTETYNNPQLYDWLLSHPR